MSTDARLSVRVVRSLVMGMTFGGRDADALLRKVDIEPVVLLDASAWLPQQKVLDCWKVVDEEGPPHFGLRLTQGIDFNLLVHIESLIDYLLVQLMISSANVRGAISHLERYGGVTFGHLGFSTETDATGTLVRFARREAKHFPKEFVNFALTFPLRALQTAERPIVPTAVFLPYASPADQQMHRAVFGSAALHFNSGSAAFRIDAKDLDVPMRGTNPALVAPLRAKADGMLAELAHSGSFALEIRSIIREALRRGDLNAAVVARKSGVSQRNLSRRLEAQGTSYRGLVDEVRSEQAQALLRDLHRPLDQIATELGFADLSSFQRAFRRWHGMALGQFRASLAKDSTHLR